MTTRSMIAFALLAVACDTDWMRHAADGDADNIAQEACEEAGEVGEAAARPPVEVDDAAVEDLQAAFKRAIAAAGPSVVAIQSTKTVSLRSGAAPLFEFFFDRPRLPREFKQQGLGSGFIIDGDGYIVTNSHVVDGADEVEVRLDDDREFVGTVVGSDPPTDLALVKIEEKGLAAIEVGDSESLEVGDWVLAMGSPFGLSHTVSAGIVSAKGRANMGIVDYEDFIQTDAAVNPGSSGGPLVDLSGRVVGINTAIASASGTNAGVAFAIPIDMAKAIVDELREGGKVVRGQLGILASELSPELAKSFAFEGSDGILVQDVVEGEAADDAGMKSGDIITKLDGKEVATVAAFRRDVARRRPGSSVEVEVWRDGQLERFEAKLGEAAAEPEARPKPPQSSEPPRIGFRLEDATPRMRKELGLEPDDAVVIMDVEPGSPAAMAGIHPGDVLEQIGDEDIDSASEAIALLRDVDLEKGVRLRVSRERKSHFVLIEP